MSATGSGSNGSGGSGAGTSGKDAEFTIDMTKLKAQFDSDPLQFHLRGRILDLKKRREAYWEHYSNMRFRNNMIGIPLLILSSGTGVTSVAQIRSSSRWLVILTTVLGVMSAFITSLQRYMRYSERAEQAKYLAKNYGRIARKIEDFMIFIESNSSQVDSKTFNNFIKEMHKDVETLTQEADDMPSILRCNPARFNTALDALADFEWDMKKTGKKPPLEEGRRGRSLSPVHAPEWRRAALMAQRGRSVSPTQSVDMHPDLQSTDVNEDSIPRNFTRTGGATELLSPQRGVPRNYARSGKPPPPAPPAPPPSLFSKQLHWK